MSTNHCHQPTLRRHPPLDRLMAGKHDHPALRCRRGLGSIVAAAGGPCAFGLPALWARDGTEPNARE